MTLVKSLIGLGLFFGKVVYWDVLRVGSFRRLERSKIYVASWVRIFLGLGRSP